MHVEPDTDTSLSNPTYSPASYSVSVLIKAPSTSGNCIARGSYWPVGLHGTNSAESFAFLSENKTKSIIIQFRAHRIPNVLRPYYVELNFSTKYILDLHSTTKFKTKTVY